MNFVAHVIVARRLAGAAASVPHLLGAAAPDLTRMARVPVTAGGGTAFRAGVQVHHRTDAAFHDSAWFREHNRGLVRALAARGVRRGPARGAAHVLVELLLDGALLAEPDHADAFAPVWASMATADPDALAVVDADHRDRWRAFLGLLTDRLDPAAYADPAYAADRTAATLARRPRLAMTDAEHAALREVATATEVRAGAPAARVVDAVVGAVSAGGR